MDTKAAIAPIAAIDKSVVVEVKRWQSWPGLNTICCRGRVRALRRSLSNAQPAFPFPYDTHRALAPCPSRASAR